MVFRGGGVSVSKFDGENILKGPYALKIVFVEKNNVGTIFHCATKPTKKCLDSEKNHSPLPLEVKWMFLK